MITSDLTTSVLLVAVDHNNRKTPIENHKKCICAFSGIFYYQFFVAAVKDFIFYNKKDWN